MWYFLMVVEKTRGTYRSTEMGTLHNCKNRTSLELQFLQKEQQHWLLYMHAAYTIVSEQNKSKNSEAAGETDWDTAMKPRRHYRLYAYISWSKAANKLWSQYFIHYLFPPFSSVKRNYLDLLVNILFSSQFFILPFPLYLPVNGN